VLPGSQFLVYPILWIVMPSEESVDALAQTPAPAT
jgi:phage shock protein PspC (stress-responsive transcriptional regulator)